MKQLDVKVKVLGLAVIHPSGVKQPRFRDQFDHRRDPRATQRLSTSETPTGLMLRGRLNLTCTD